MRNKNTPAKGIFTFNLSDEAKRRAKEHLEKAGIRLDQVPPLIWPDDAISAYQPHMYAPWQFTTKADIRRKRQEDAKHVLWFKREYGVSKRLPAYVWVFWCPGISGIFEGWWTYIIGRGFSHGGKFQTDSDLILKAMDLFPVILPSLFDLKEDWRAREVWMMEFAKRYQRCKWCGKPQGKAPIWCEVEGNDIIKILSRAEWPKQGVKF